MKTLSLRTRTTIIEYRIFGCMRRVDQEQRNATKENKYNSKTVKQYVGTWNNNLVSSPNKLKLIYSS